MAPDTNRLYVDLMRSINHEVTPMFRMIASAPADYTVTVTAGPKANPYTSRKETGSFLQGTLYSFTGGTIVFPAISGGNIVLTPGTDIPLVLTSNNYVKALIIVNSSGELAVQLGTEAPSSAAATLPVQHIDGLVVGYVEVFNNAGTIDVIQNSAIYQFDFNKYMPLGHMVGHNDTQTLYFKTYHNPIFTGNTTGSLIPLVDSTDSLGSTTNKWDELHVNYVEITESLEAPASSNILRIGVTDQTDQIYFGSANPDFSTSIYIGGSSDKVIISGELTYVNQADLRIEDKNIQLNVGGLDASSAMAGIDVIESNTLLAATEALWQAASTIRLTMASTGGISVGDIVSVSGFTNTNNNGTFDVTAVSPGSYIEVHNPNRNDATDDETGATASVTDPDVFAYIRVNSGRDGWSMLTPEGTAPFTFFQQSSSNSWSIGKTDTGSGPGTTLPEIGDTNLIIRPDADGTGGWVTPHDDDTYLGHPDRRWQLYASNADFDGDVFFSGSVTITGPITTTTVYKNVSDTRISNYAVTALDNIIPVSTQSGAVTITLPLISASNHGVEYIIKDVGGQVSTSGKELIVQTSGGDVIYGSDPTPATSMEFVNDYQSLTFVANDNESGWMIV